MTETEAEFHSNQRLSVLVALLEMQAWAPAQAMLTALEATGAHPLLHRRVTDAIAHLAATLVQPLYSAQRLAPTLSLRCRATRGAGAKPKYPEDQLPAR